MFRPLAILLLIVSFQAPAFGCGGPDAACEVPLGSYFVSEPENSSTAPRPAVFFFHGGGGWGSRIFKIRAQMTADFNARGYVVIAPNGKKRPGSRWGPVGPSFPNSNRIATTSHSRERSSRMPRIALTSTRKPY